MLHNRLSSTDNFHVWKNIYIYDSVEKKKCSEELDFEY